jgi:glycosyltransferase involved in cell wall biosynthesis
MYLYSNILKKVNNDHLTAKLVFILVAVYVVFSLVHIFKFGGYGITSLSIYAIALTIFLVDGIKLLIQCFGRKVYFQVYEEINKVTVIIPTFNGAETLPMVIESLLRKFKPEQIIISSNGSTDNTIQIGRRFKVKIKDIKEPIGKVNAINQALKLVNTPYVLIMDDDTFLGDALVPTNLLEDKYSGVAFKVLPVKQGLISILQTHEYRKSMYLGRESHNHSGTVLTISGAIGLFKTTELIRQINKHTKEFSGEDLQRTLLVHLGHPRNGVVVADSLVETMVPNNLQDLFRQRVYGWFPGFYCNINYFIKIIFSRRSHTRLKIEAFYELFVVTLLDPVRLLTLPVLLSTPVYIIIFYISYVLIEAVPWLVMHRKEPFWVVLVAPIYGLFNFSAKIVAAGVFLYRRLSFYIGHHEEYDHYKIASTRTKILANLATIPVIFTLFMPFTLLYNVDPRFNLINNQRRIDAINNLAVPEISISNYDLQPTGTEGNYYRFEAKPGDSLWSLSQKAIVTYFEDHNLYYDINKLNNLTYRTMSKQNIRNVQLGHSYTITLAAIQPLIGN